MTDFFILLGVPRRPWIEPDSLRARFLELSTPLHPDRFHNAPNVEKQATNEIFSELNAAYNCLREPRERLRHLLELETGAKPKDVQRIPPGTMDLFMEVGHLCREVEAFLKEKEKVTSPLLKVQVFQKAMAWTDKLNALQQKVNAKRAELEAELKTMNSLWERAGEHADLPASPPSQPLALPLERLEQVYRILSYVARWTQQIQERVVPLSF